VSADLSAAERARAGRPPELEEALNAKLVHPLSDRLTTALVPTGITPNVVSAMGVVASIGAGLFYAMPGWPFTTALAFAFHLGWHVLDGADGDLARRTGRMSPSGEIVDGVCDYLSHVAVYGALAWVLSVQIGPWAWLLAIAAGVSRAVQANHYESSRRTYQWWVYDHPWMRQSLSDRPPARGWARLAGALARGYLKVSAWASADDAMLLAHRARLMGGPEAGPARNLYAKAYLPLVKRAAWLGALHETQAVFVCMLVAGPTGWGPLILFAYELIVLNGVMAWSSAPPNRAEAHQATDRAARGGGAGGRAGGQHAQAGTRGED
jgi:hypothetical protein